MADPRDVLLGALLAVTAVFVLFWIRRARAAPRQRPATPTPAHLLIGFVTDFFDALGIGSFATTTAFYRLPGAQGRNAPARDGARLVRDELIPGTLNVGHAVPTVAQALIYTSIVEVEFRTLVLLIVAAVGGSWMGATIVSGLPRRQIQRGMGVALLAAAVLMTLAALGRMPGGGDALGLTGGRLVAACAINFGLGALMTLGIGLYAPCMIMVSLMGMNPTAAFPIMMGSCAFLMPVGSATFIRTQKYDLRAAAGLAIGGVPGVLLAAWVFSTLPIAWVRWLVVVVVVYTAATLLRSAAQSPAHARA